MASPDSIDTLARTFNDAAAALGLALNDKLHAEDPQLAAKVAAAMQMGERLMICLEFNGLQPAIRLMTMDDYQQVKQIMTIAAKAPSAQ